MISSFKNLRIYILFQKSMKDIPRETIRRASCNAHLGHFFVLNQIAKNTNPETFVELIAELVLNTVALNQNISEPT